MDVTVVPIIKKKKVKKGKSKQLKHFVYLIYNKEGREALKGKFIMPGLIEESKLGSIFFFL